ncbi:MAG: ribosomal protein S18-alanine N-acetyltransferase [Gemmatimonadaceae bacterium]
MAWGERAPWRGGRAMPLEGGLRLRAATSADLDGILELERASFTDPWSRQSFRALFDDPRVLFTVACDARDIVLGYVAAWFIVDEGEIATLAVAPEVRRRGLGASLLDSIVDAARVRRVSALYLEVRESNAAARALYASRGFLEVGRRRNYYRSPVEDARVLRLTLPAA